MPVKLTYYDKTSASEIENAFAVISELHFNLDKKTINIAYDVFRSAEAYNAGATKMQTVVINIDSLPRNAVHGAAPILQEGVPPTFGDPPIVSSGYIDDVPYVEYGDAPLLDAGSPPVYGDAPVITAAVPSFNQVMFANIATLKDVASTAYNIASTQTHLFKDAIFIAPSGYNIR